MKKNKDAIINEITENGFASIIDELREAEPGPVREDIWYYLGRMGLAEDIKHLSYLLETENWTVKPEDRRAMLEPADKPLRKLSPEEITRIKADIEELGSADLCAAWRTVARLGRRRGMAIEYISEATASPNEAIRHLALHVLERMGDNRTYPVILEMTQDPIPDTRWCAYEILGKVGKERAIPELINALRHFGEEWDGAVRGLELVGKPAIPALMDVLQSGNKEARIGAASALSSIGDTSVIAPLSKLFTDPDFEIRILGIESIARVVEDNPEEFGEECLELVQSILNDPDKRVRDNAGYWQNELEQIV